MGLDMYLSRKTYVKNWDFKKDTEVYKVSVKLNGKKHPFIDPKKISEITEDVGYWRKANAIHKWFVENVQNGEDNCKEYYVDMEQLKELHSLCVQIDKNHDLAPKLLPTQSGFFFGGTEYDEWYFKDIKNTIEILEELIKLDNKISEINKSGTNPHIFTEYYYQSSW